MGFSPHIACERCNVWFESTAEIHEVQTLRGNVKIFACPKCGGFVAVMIEDKLFLPTLEIDKDESAQNSKRSKTVRS